MGRKRKHIDPDCLSKSTLPPCRVCDAPGAGFHYGANTCEACKGFFHRSLKLHGQYKCEGDGNCPIEHGVDKLCQYCRYRKCLTVGMAKEAIKTGRYTSVKRTNDILEIKRLQKVTKSESPSQSGDSQILKLLNRHTVSSASSSTSYLDSDSQTGDCFSAYSNQDSQMSVGDSSQSGQGQHGTFIQHQPSKCKFLPGQSPSYSMSQIQSPETDNCHGQDMLCSPMQSEFSHSAFSPGQSNSACMGHHCDQGYKDSMSQSSPEDVRTPVTPKSETRAEKLSCQEIQSLFSDSPSDPRHAHLYHMKQSVLSPGSAVSPLSQISSHGSPMELTAAKSSPSVLTEVATSLLSLSASPSSVPGTSLPSTSTFQASSTETFTSLGSPPLLSSASTTSMRSPASSAASPSPFGARAASVSSSSSSNMDLYNSDVLGTFCNSCGGPVDIKDITKMFSDKDAVIKMLVEANEEFVTPVFGNLTEEEIKQQQMEHFEVCKLQKEMFGELHRLPDHEYDYIYVTTGLDTDDRQSKMHNLGAGLESVIRAMVNFCNVIPGFSMLDISDKVSLIKYSRQDFGLFCSFKFNNCDLMIMRGLDNQWKCEHELLRFLPEVTDLKEVLGLHFRFCRSLQDLKLTDEELVVTRALTVMAPDRDPPVDSALAREIYWQLTECLIYLLSQRHSRPMVILAKIVDRLTEARSQTEKAYRCIRKLKVEKYSNVLDNPLLREMCTGIFFDSNAADI